MCLFVCLFVCVYEIDCAIVCVVSASTILHIAIVVHV